MAKNDLFNPSDNPADRIRFEHMKRLMENGHHLYQMNDDLDYDCEPLVAENTFIDKAKDTEPVPTYSGSRELLPRIVWDGHDATVSCYDKAWQIAFGNLHSPKPEDGMVSNYIDTAFNGFLFMWDSSFITMFGKYGSRAFDFQRTLDNLYARQHMDGFICREICEAKTGDQFHRFDPVSTGPNILPWAEWESYLVTDDEQRIRAVFPVLLAYHLWLRKYHTWPDGTYWSTGWGCGMDNQPRLKPGYSCEFHHGHMVWADACIQQILSCQTLIKMARLIGRESDVSSLVEEEARLRKVVNEKLWDDETAFYYDLWNDGRKNYVKSIGAYWALLTGIVPEEKLGAFVAHLENEAEFKRPHRVPTLSADHPEYEATGGYWRGGVWAPTNYMVLKGLEKYGFHRLANDIARSHIDHVTQVFEKTGTLWENYAPESAQPGQPAKSDFVGWTGLSPISMLMEYVFGIHGDAQNRAITWRITCLERHGVMRYPLGNATVNLICPAHGANERPSVEITSDDHIDVTVIWPDGSQEKIST
ncbi:MAG: glycoside hydrolase [Clostridia bacterium]|nr:glycoside hydrolase [Clostridia bacterium]